MKRKRRHLSAEFNARVAKAALIGERSIQEIAQENEIAPSQVSAWKKDLEEHLAEIFERKNGANDAAKREEKRAVRLEQKVGQLVIEKDFLEKKALRQIRMTSSWFPSLLTWILTEKLMTERSDTTSR